MKTTSSLEQAHRYDRFSTDVNAVFCRLRKQIPTLQKMKLKKEKLFAEVYVFFFADENNNKQYLTN